METGQQINLDNGEGKIISGCILDDIRNVCTSLEIVFECPQPIVFDEEGQNYFTFRMIDWIPISYKMTCTNQDTYNYIVTAMPKPVKMPILKSCINSRILASEMNVELLEGSVSLPIYSPVINLYAGQMIREIRRQELNKGYVNQDIGSCGYFYFNSTNLLSLTWKMMMGADARELQNDPLIVGNDIVQFIDDRTYSEFESHCGAEVWTQKDFLNRILGRKFDISTTAPAYFLSTYSIHFSNSSLFDNNMKFLCIRTQSDIMNPTGFINTFAEIQYV